MNYFLWSYVIVAVLVGFGAIWCCISDGGKWYEWPGALCAGVLWPLLAIYLIGLLIEGDDHTAGL